MLLDSRADIKQIYFNVFKIGPLRFQENVDDGKRLVGLLRDFLSKFRIAKVQTRPNDEYPFCFFGQQFSCCLKR